jgi:hypothetical protein
VTPTAWAGFVTLCTDIDKKCGVVPAMRKGCGIGRATVVGPRMAWLRRSGLWAERQTRAAQARAENQARAGRNPATRESLEIAASKKVAVRVARELKAAA